MTHPETHPDNHYCKYEDNPELWQALADWIDRLARDPDPEEELDRLTSIVKVKRRW